MLMLAGTTLVVRRPGEGPWDLLSPPFELLLRVRSRVRAATTGLRVAKRRSEESCRIGIRSLWIQQIFGRHLAGHLLHLKSQSRMWQVIVAISKHPMLAHLGQADLQQVRFTISKPAH